MNPKIIIIGAQGGGMSCAAKLSRNLPKAEILVIEQQNYLSLGACGLPYYVEGIVKDKKLLNARTVADFKNTNINILINHKVTNVNTKTSHVSMLDISTNKILNKSYDYLVIASGAKVNTIVDNNERISTLKNLYDAEAILTSIAKLKVVEVAMLGGGYIGLELLEALTKHKLKVSIIDGNDAIAGKFLDTEFLDIIASEIKKHNINIITKTKISAIDIKDNKVVVKTNKATLKFDFLIQAIGSTPETDFLGKELKKTSNGAIIVNKFGNTNIKNVYATGDCAALKHSILKKSVNIQLATLSNKLAKIIADNITSTVNKSKKLTSFTSVLGSSALKLFTLEIAKTGITEEEAKLNKINYKTAFLKDTVLPGYMDNNGMSDNHFIYGKIIFSPKTQTILGVQIIGPNALYRTHAISVAIEGKIKLADLAYMDLGYTPTFNKTIDFVNLLASIALKT